MIIANRYRLANLEKKSSEIKTEGRFLHIIKDIHQKVVCLMQW